MVKPELIKYVPIELFDDIITAIYDHFPQPPSDVTIDDKEGDW